MTRENGETAVIPNSHNDNNKNQEDGNNNKNNKTHETTTTTTTTTPRHTLRDPPNDPGTRFGGLAGVVESSMRMSIGQQLGSLTAPFCVTAADLGHLSNERTRTALADLLERGVLLLQSSSSSSSSQKGGEVAEVVDDQKGEVEVEVDLEKASPQQKLQHDVGQLVERMRNEEQLEDRDEAAKNADMAAVLLTAVLLRSSPESGIDPREVEHRRQVFGTNAIADKKLDSFLALCWEAVQDFVLVMLIVLGIISIVVETTTLEDGENCTTCWIEGAAILCSVCIVVLVTASIDYAKQFAFIRLSQSLLETNTKSVIRDGKQVSVVDDDIVVGDILSVNSHNLASIPADCVLLGPPADLKMNESSLTGESKMISKHPGDIVLSGTNAVQGSGKMVVIAVGVHSVAGRIKARVYESADHEGDDLGGEDDNSPLFVKLDTIAKRIGICGSVAAAVAFVGSCIIGLAVHGDPVKDIIEYLVTAITVLAVAVPEGLPLAVTLSLAFSSNKMMKEQNLVKHLDACETMGCATTICTDKTGRSLLANVVSLFLLLRLL